MKVLLCAINAKYIHSNLAVLSLRAYSREAAKKAGWEVVIKEYTINHYEEYICGHYEVGRYAWIVEDVKVIEPI